MTAQKSLTFCQLQAEYGPGLVEIDDPLEVARQMTSKSSCCWLAGSAIGNTGWTQLATDRPHTFVCKSELLTDPKKVAAKKVAP
jgi:hypothetical protein